MKFVAYALLLITALSPALADDGTARVRAQVDGALAQLDAACHTGECRTILNNLTWQPAPEAYGVVFLFRDPESRRRNSDEINRIARPLLHLCETVWRALNPDNPWHSGVHVYVFALHDIPDYFGQRIDGMPIEVGILPELIAPGSRCRIGHA